MRRKNTSKNKIVYEILLTDYDFDKSPLYEYDRDLDEFENVKRKNILIQYGKSLIDKKQYNNAILYYQYLSNNTYFINDYYPYRQLTLLYEKTEDYNASIINIKKLMYSKIYLNDYQFTWFIEKIRQMGNKTFITEYEFQEWIDHYQGHGALYEKKLNKFLADRFIKKEDKIIVISEDEFDHRQKCSALMETGLIYERVGNYELAVNHYSNIISAGEFNYYQFYQRLCLCLEKIHDHIRMVKAIRLYYISKPINKNDVSDEWFENKLKWVNKRLIIRYTVDDLKNSSI